MCLETTGEAIQAGKPAPAKKNNDNGKKQKNGDHRPSLEKTNKKPKAPNQRVPRPPPSKFTNYTDMISSWPQSKLGYSSSLTYCVETALRGTRISTVSTTRKSVIPLKSASPSRMRLISSFDVGTSKITSTTGGPSHKMMDLKQNPYEKSR